MKLTMRDILLLLWINGFGFVTVKQVAKWMGTDFSVGARRLRLLKKAGFLRTINQKILHGNPLVLTKKGVLAAKDSLPPLKGIRPGEYWHDAYLVDVARGLTAQFPGSSFEPARRVRQAQGWINGQHLPDGYLHLKNGERIIIELELSLKSQRRITSILAQHTSDLASSQVWYLTDSDVIASAIKRASAGLDRVRVIGLSRKSINAASHKGAS